MALVQYHPPSFQDLLVSANPFSERFFDLLDRGLSQRFSGSLEVAMLSYELSMVDVRKKSHNFDVQWAGLEAKITKSRRGDTLYYHVPNITLSEAGSDIRLHERPSGLNIRMSKLMVAVTDAIRADVLTHSDILHVKVVVPDVVNLDIINLLMSIGFEIAPETQFRVAGFANHSVTRFDEFAVYSDQPSFSPHEGRSMVLSLDVK